MMPGRQKSPAFPVGDSGRDRVLDTTSSCWSVIEAGAQRYAGAYVPPQFRSMVVSHAICTLRGNWHSDYAGAPVFLVIVGPPGIGKTYQTIASASAENLRTYYCSASKLTGDLLGESADRLSALYEAAGRDVRDGRLSIIVIDDFHLGEAAVSKKMETTVNSNILTARLMNVCDEARLTRVPIVLTANRLGDIEPALLRDGRARTFFWEPTAEDMRLAVRKAYSAMGIASAVADRVIDAYGGKTIAFYSAVAEEARRLVVAESLSGIHRIEDLVANRCQFAKLCEEDMIRAARNLEAKSCA